MAATSPEIVIAPVVVDPTDLVSISYQLDNDKLNSTLQRITNTVSRNARVTNNTQEQCENLKQYMEVNMNKIQRMVNMIDDTTRQTREQVGKLHEEIALLKASTVRTEDYETEKRVMWQPLKRAEQFVDEVEGGKADRVQRLIKNYCDVFVPRWYEPVGVQLWNKVKGELGFLKDSVDQKIKDDIVSAESLMKSLISESKDEMLVDVQKLEAKGEQQVEELKDLVSSMQENINSSIGEVESAQGKIKEEVVAELGPRVETSEGEILNLKQLLGLAPGGGVLPVAGGGSSDQLSGTAGDRSISPPQSLSASFSSNQANTSKSPTNNKSGGKDQQQNPSTSPVMRPPTAARRTSQTSSPLSPLKQQQQSQQHGKASQSLLNTGPFAELRREIMAAQKEKHQTLEDTVGRSIFETKHELNVALSDKVGMSTLQDLLYKYRDETLYATVKNNAAEVEKLRQEKADVTVMQSLLNDKAEKTDLETKVDRQYLNTVQLQNQTRIDEVIEIVGVVENKGKEDRAKVSALMDLASGGAGSASMNSALFASSENHQATTAFDSHEGLLSRHEMEQLQEKKQKEQLERFGSASARKAPPSGTPQSQGLHLPAPLSTTGGGGSINTLSPTSYGSPLVDGLPPGAAAGGGGGTGCQNRPRSGAPPSSAFPREYAEGSSSGGARGGGGRAMSARNSTTAAGGKQQVGAGSASFSELLFRTKPEEYAKSKVQPPKH